MKRLTDGNTTLIMTEMNVRQASIGLYIELTPTQSYLLCVSIALAELSYSLLSYRGYLIKD